jgi:CRISPR-associated endonuclease Csn1
MSSLQNKYILGLDLGVQSVGWAMVDMDSKGRPCGVQKAGVRCFDSGVGNETEIATGKDESQNIKRRQMRLQRRQLWRRGRRLKKIFHVLQHAGLLPTEEARTPEQRHDILINLDAELAKTFVPQDDRVANHLLPYRLRALALDQTLPPFALGRAIFHLAQRRGFLSNRKTDARDSDETSTVKAGIAELWRQMEAANARTLGEYFSALDPEEQRIRQRWTARQMYLDEFENIWNAQMPHQPNLTPEQKQIIHNAIFHQRPLKSQANTIGTCELETACRRAPRASLEAQRFRYLQKVNDLEISTPDGKLWRLNDPQHADLRKKLIDLLDTHAEIEFKSLRSKLGLKKTKGADTD